MFHIAALGKPKARAGKKLEPLAAAPIVADTASAAPDTGMGVAAAQLEPVARPDGWACRLVDGCTLGHGHANICTFAQAYVRTPDRVNYAELNGSRRGSKRPTPDRA